MKKTRQRILPFFTQTINECWWRRFLFSVVDGLDDDDEFAEKNSNSKNQQQNKTRLGIGFFFEKIIQCEWWSQIRQTATSFA